MKPFPHFPYYCVTSGPESREIVWQELHSSYFEKYILFSSSGLRQRGRILASFSVREEKLSRILVDPLKQIIPHDLVHGWSQEDQLRELNQNPPGRFWSAFFKVFATPTA